MTFLLGIKKPNITSFDDILDLHVLKTSIKMFFFWCFITIVFNLIARGIISDSTTSNFKVDVLTGNSV